MLPGKLVRINGCGEANVDIGRFKLKAIEDDFNRDVGGCVMLWVCVCGSVEKSRSLGAVRFGGSRGSFVWWTASLLGWPRVCGSLWARESSGETPAAARDAKVIHEMR